MTTTTVYAVVQATIEIPVRASSPKETLEELQRVSINEAQGILRNNLPNEFNVVGTPKFSYAKVITQ